MSGPRVLAESLFDTSQFPSHSVTAEEQATGNEAWRVGNARRQTRDHWTSTTANSATYVTVACDRVRAADELVIDRNHNLNGKTVRLRVSNQSSFGTYTEVVTQVFPSRVYYTRALANGARTEEGAFAIKFDRHAGKYWRLVIDAGGAGYKPQVGGVYLGQSLAFDNLPQLPWDDEPRELVYDQVVSPSLWAASTRKAQRRVGNFVVRVSGEQEYTKVRKYIHARFWRGSVMWYTPDQSRAERSVLMVAPPGVGSAPYDGQWPERMLGVSMIEHEPRPT